jgi:hypothetical protein
MSQQPTRPNGETRATERDDAQTPAGADREPTTEEAARADELTLDPKVAEHEREMAERGADQQGEGKLP